MRGSSASRRYNPAPAAGPPTLTLIKAARRNLPDNAAMETLTLVREFARDRLGIEPERVTPETDFRGLGIDSFMLLELLFDFEDKTGTPLPRDLPTPRTVGELNAILTRLRG